MARPTNGPKGPSTKEIDEFVDLTNYYLDLEQDEKKVKQLDRLIEVLDWAAEQVKKRQLYSKKFQLKDRERNKLFRERLGDEYDSVIEKARQQAEKNLSDEVANEEPTERELAELKEAMNADEQE